MEKRHCPSRVTEAWSVEGHRGMVPLPLPLPIYRGMVRRVSQSVFVVVRFRV